MKKNMSVRVSERTKFLMRELKRISNEYDVHPAYDDIIYVALARLIKEVKTNDADFIDEVVKAKNDVNLLNLERHRLQNGEKE